MNRAPRLLVVVAVGVVIFSWLGCGGSSVDRSIGPVGGTVCSADGIVCIEFPSDAVDQTRTVRITPSSEAPAAALSESYDIAFIGVTGDAGLLKPASVRFSLENFDASVLSDIPADQNELNFLRIYTRQGEGEWEPLGKSGIDRVTNKVLGETTHLSPFVLLRSDRLPDGGLPIDIDGGVRDSGVIVVPPIDAGFDAGRPDAGRPDAGFDAGVPDAGFDAGTPDAGVDAGFDAGVPDAGFDAGLPDAGFDAGVPDAGFDAGVPDAGFDAGVPDAGFDAGQPDAGVDAGSPDAGDAG